MTFCRIAVEINQFGYHYTWEQVQNKWKTLLRSYKAIKDHNGETGKERRNWKYYDVIDELLFGNPAIDPPVVVHNGVVIRASNKNLEYLKYLQQIVVQTLLPLVVQTLLPLHPNARHKRTLLNFFMTLCNKTNNNMTKICKRNVVSMIYLNSY